MDWIQEPFEVWTRFHTSPDAPLIRQRWMFTDQPFLPVGTQCVFLNRIWDDDKESDLRVGQVQPTVSEYAQDHRWEIPPLVFNGHMCNPQWLTTGEPWPVPETLPPTVYLLGWIPECCVMVCPEEACLNEQVHGEPASQNRQYAIPAAQATATTPFTQLSVANNQGNTVPNNPGFTFTYHQLGTTAPPAINQQVVFNNVGVLVECKRRFTTDEDNWTEEVIDATGVIWQLTIGGVPLNLQLTQEDDVGKLTGENLKIDPAILPPGVENRASASYTAAGTTRVDATAIVTSGARISVPTLGQGVVLPEATANGNRIFNCACLSSSPAAVALVYPALGQAFTGQAVNDTYGIVRGQSVLFIENGGPNGEWGVVVMDQP